ncbi:MAG: AI-2E family transporter [Patescibacteria group bacterium]
MDTRPFEVSWASLWKILFFFLFVYVLFSGKQILLGLFLAIIISSGLDIIVDFFERKGVPRTLGVILIFLCGLLIAAIIIYAVIPLIIADLNQLFSGFSASSSLGQLLNLKNSKSFDAFINQFYSDFFSSTASPLDFLSKALGGVGLAIAVLVSSFYLSLTRDGVEKFLRFIIPPDYEKTAMNIYERSRKKISSWFQTQIFNSFIMGVSTWVLLSILGVKHAFILGLFAGIFEIMPFVGPILAGALSVLVAFLTSAWLALYTLIAFLVLHQLESHLLIPLIMNRSVGLHPVIVIVALLIGAETAGFLGILISVPAAAVFHEVLNEWSRKRRPVSDPI